MLIARGPAFVHPNVLKAIIWIEKAGKNVLEKSSEIYAKA
jgi:hypothetical protein